MVNAKDMGTTKTSNDLSLHFINLCSVLSFVVNISCTEGLCKVFYVCLSCTFSDSVVFVSQTFTKS